MLAAGQWSAAISRSYTLQSLSGRAVVCCSRPIVSCCIPVYSSLVPSAARRTFPCFALRSSRLASSLSSRDADAAPFEPAPTALSTVYVAIGSNMEPRFPSLLSAVSKINDLSSTKVLRTSYLYESLPMYITDQASFLNACLKVTTSLPPHTLLKELKKIESIVGRRPTVKNGPRLIDLDILLVEDERGKSVPVNINEGSETESLIVPHPRIAEREFVLRPLNDIYPKYAGPLLKSVLTSSAAVVAAACGSGSSALSPSNAVTTGAVPSSSFGAGNVVQVLPLPRNRFLHLHPNKTLVMGILNVTPDSFSDGGKYNSSVDAAVQQALQLVKDGADIIDIGGESTRPGAEEVSVEEEVSRVVPIILSLRSLSPTVAISVDTRRAAVAAAAVAAGADLVNDVSAGTFDGAMLDTVKGLGVPLCLMHSRGTPATMGTLATYADVVKDVAKELRERVIAAEKAGVGRWLLVLDAGLGFAKDLGHNVQLVARANELRHELEGAPMLLGASRKRFVGSLTNVSKAEERDVGTVAVNGAAILAGGAQIVRVHNVKAMKEAAMVFDAIAQTRDGERQEEGVTAATGGNTVGKHRVDATAKRPTKVCDPYEQNGMALTPKQAAELAGTIDPKWKLNGDSTVISREFLHNSFLDASKFAQQLSFIAFNNNHYPKISIERRLGKGKWLFVSTAQCSTEVLRGLSFNDFQLCMLIDVEIETPTVKKMMAEEVQAGKS